MHIVFLSIVFPYPKSGIWPGIERWAGELAKALVKAGCRVTVLTTFWNGGIESETWEGVEIRRLPDARQRWGRAAHLLNLNVRSFGRSILTRKDLLASADVLHAFVGLPIQEDLKRLGVPLFASFPHREKAERLADHFTQMSRFGTEKRFLRAMDSVFAGSAAAREVLIREYALEPGRVQVVHLGVNEADFHPPEAPRPADPARERPDGIRFLYVGPLIRRKGLRTLVEALPVLEAAGVNYRVRFVGEGPQEEELRGVAGSLGVAGRIEFAGFKRGADLTRAYQEADVFVFPSILEGFGLVMVEAMATGLVVVTTDVPPMPEVVGEAGLTVSPGDPAKLGEALRSIATDAGLRQRLAQAGIERVQQRFLWSRVAERTMERYREARMTASEPA